MRIYIKYIVGGLLFGLGLGLVPPYPNQHGHIIWAIASALYFLILFVPSLKFRRFWMHFGYSTFLSMLVPGVWFFHLTMMYGLWYPPDYFPIIQNFNHVDGEASYDAHVSNLFFILWPVSTIVLAAGHLTSAGNRTPQKLSP